MKKIKLVIIGMSLLTSGAFANLNENQIETKVKAPKKVDDRTVHSGLRVSAYASNMELKQTITVTDTNTDSSYYEDETGSDSVNRGASSFLIGYEYVRVMSPRFSVLAGRTSYSYNGDTLYNDTLEGNVTFGVNKNIHFASGLHVGKLTLTEENDRSRYKDTLGIGLQTSATFQFHRSMALDLRFVTTSYREEKVNQNETLEYHLSLGGAQLGLSGTF
jgi:hypothetical protein